MAYMVKMNGKFAKCGRVFAISALRERKKKLIVVPAVFCTLLKRKICLQNQRRKKYSMNVFCLKSDLAHIVKRKGVCIYHLKLP